MADEPRLTPESNTIQYKVASWENNAVLAFQRESMGLGLKFVQRDQVPMSNWSIEMLGDLKDLVVMSDGPDPHGMEAVLLRHGARSITLVHVFDGWAMVRSANDDMQQAQEMCATVAERIRFRDDEDETQLVFWALDPDKWPQVFRRKVETPRWDELSDNYNAETQGAMEQLLALRDCPNERMILWHGPAGTGKTHALRALVREWRTWCDIAFITDPERFVGGSPTYLFKVANFQMGRSAKEAASRSKLIICEDAGELMTPEARSATGQGLSRLLNMTDGMLGQGMKMMVLITTNEPISRLHPAVVRPGRCLQETEFGALDVTKANDWLSAHGSEARVDTPTTLAELYATLSGRISRSPALAALS